MENAIGMQALTLSNVDCRNAELTNTYKLDLHALHVDEALEKIEETRRDLRKFPCKHLQLTVMTLQFC